MLEVYNTAWKSDENTAVALGYFDGVHLAHQYLIRQMTIYAQDNNLNKAVFTFTKSVTLNHKGKDLSTQSQKLEQMRKIGLDLYYSPDFSLFSNLTPEEFVQQILINSMKAKAVFCGEDFFFGKNRSGNVQVLKELCEKFGIYFHQVDLVTLDGVPVSSTAIREALEDGDMEKAALMLGRPYSIKLPVVHGKKIGRTIGTPTINQIFPKTMCMPKEGVYISSVEFDGTIYPSATGISNRPTVEGTEITCETHILDFSGDLYHKDIEVEVHMYLFAPRKFNSLEELGEMILTSARKSKEYLEEKGFLKQ